MITLKTANSGKTNVNTYEIRDNKYVLYFFNGINSTTDKVASVLGNTDFWGCDLTEIDGAVPFVKDTLDLIKKHGVKATMEHL